MCGGKKYLLFAVVPTMESEKPYSVMIRPGFLILDLTFPGDGWFVPGKATPWIALRSVASVPNIFSISVRDWWRSQAVAISSVPFVMPGD